MANHNAKGSKPRGGKSIRVSLYVDDATLAAYETARKALTSHELSKLLGGELLGALERSGALGGKKSTPTR